MTKLQSGRRKSITSSIPMCKGIQIQKCMPVESCSKQESIITGRTIIKHKNRSYAQFHLDFGQSDFLLHNCSICGVKFAPGEAEDEKAHKKFHNTYTQGLPLKRIVGCLVAEPIKEAFKVICCSSAASSYGSRKKETNPSSTTLQFGDIIFRREAGKSACLVNE